MKQAEFAPITLSEEINGTFETRKDINKNKFLTNETKIRPRRDSNSQSSDPNSDLRPYLRLVSVAHIAQDIDNIFISSSDLRLYLGLVFVVHIAGDIDNIFISSSDLRLYLALVFVVHIAGDTQTFYLKLRPTPVPRAYVCSSHRWRHPDLLFQAQTYACTSGLCL
ncbi:hypothetical protein PoB_006887400 [Plakobranchus ocellatus]|uniref:Uncharacterized protein n=1 Tax=Plakobranchus ocellatus TaxID=259542 RepID=A0AAV4DDT8_9GAST|nr:hypothetical protein PoB_006887400 [Plakobranchus ocellatus]